MSKGVLHRYKDSYTIPIPSLYDYLTEKAGRIREARLRDEEIGKQLESKDQSEAEGPQKEAGNHTPDSPSPEKEEGKDPTIRKSEKNNPIQEPPPGRDPFNSDQDTDREMER